MYTINDSFLKLKFERKKEGTIKKIQVETDE